ncbi:MAG: hypothetical protein M1416_02830 [Candidatus Pacearchaeota archaeon]|nr:hypothetical protein [Candidatus Pacearchaeota archaeon]
MAQKNKLYLPKDEELNLFWIAKSKDGLVISLKDFGYDCMHLTLFFKEIGDDNVLFNIHITEEGKDKKFEIKFEYNRKEIEEKLNKKIELIKPDLEKLILSLKNKSVERPEKAICLICLAEKNFNFEKKMNKRETATQLWDNLKKMEIVDLQKSKLTYDCDNKEHYQYIDVETGREYLKTSLGFIPYKDLEFFKNEMFKIIKNNFNEEFSFLESLFNQVKEGLEKLK